MRLSQQAGLTTVGRVRKNNEDVFAIRPDLHVALVADGMGGAACGEVASDMAARAVCDYFDLSHGQPSRGTIEGAIQFANGRVWQAAQAEGACDGMGTTIVVAHWSDGRLWIANVGDSRGYLLRRGELRQLSRDQNLATDLRENLKLTEEQIAAYPQRNALTMAIGTRPDVQARFHECGLEPDDTVLLCTDGLSNPLNPEMLRSFLTDTGAPLDRAAAALVEAALDRGSTDNVTVVLLRFAL
jgi:protein phosphatase